MLPGLYNVGGSQGASSAPSFAMQLKFSNNGLTYKKLRIFLGAFVRSKNLVTVLNSLPKAKFIRERVGKCKLNCENYMMQNFMCRCMLSIKHGFKVHFMR